MAKAAVGLGVNTELKMGAKYDRFQPYLYLDLEYSVENMTIEQQLDKGEEVIDKIWDRLSNVIERKSTQELNREFVIGDKEPNK